MKKGNKKGFFNNKKQVKGKALSAWVIVMIAIFMLFAFGLGLYFGTRIYLTENKNSSDSSNNEVDNSEVEETNNYNEIITITDITETVKNNTENDVVYLKKAADGVVEELVINKKTAMSFGGFNEFGLVYQVGENYLVTTHGTDINTVHYFLLDSNGSLIQEIYELEDRSMVIASGSDKYNDITISGNIIELYGTRLTHGPSLVKYDNGKRAEHYICDANEMKKASVGDDYVVVARYQLVYSNNAFKILKVDGTEETLGQIKASCTNE